VSEASLALATNEVEVKVQITEIRREQRVRVP